ncbi:MAG TPA: hypothetical protein VK787_11795, partial [Puia sp.]|nr:hypothetical protein [Puia sp.]
RNKNTIKNNEQIRFMGTSATHAFYLSNYNLLLILQKQTNTKYYTPSPDEVEEYSKNEIRVVSSDRTFLLHIEKEINKVEVKNDLLKDIEYQKGFLNSVNKKLTNEKFVQNAKPEVIALEEKKRADAEAKIKALEESLANLQ